MRKLISFVLVIMMIASVAVSSIPASAVTHGFIRGDVNDDSDLSMKDILVLRRFIAGLSKAKDVSLLAADLNADSEIDMKDVLRLRRIIAGLEAAEGNNTDHKKKVGEIKIGGRNISRFTIVYPETTDSKYFNSSCAYATTVLQSYIKDACGIALNIAYDDAAVTGYKIIYTYDYDDKYDLGKEGYILEATDDGNFVITCGTMRGSVYATYEFLESIVGYRFLTEILNEKIVYLYENPLIDVPTGYYDRDVPSAEYRSSPVGSYFPALRVNASEGSAYEASKNPRAGELGGAVGTTYIHAHSFVYYEAGFENRNDSELDSVAGGRQPCMTSEEFYNKCIDFMYKQVEWRTGLGQIPGIHYTQISCSANDNGNYCTCANCKAAYEADESVAGALIKLCNRVAEKFCADYPELEIYTAAYAGSHVPPKMTRPDPRICVCFCSVGCNNHLLRNPDECDLCGGNPRLQMELGYNGQKVNQNNRKWMEYLKGWLELTDNVWYWYYTVNFAFYVSPAANLFNFYDDIKYLTELGVKGFYLEGCGDAVNFNFEPLRFYLEARILWHPEMTEEEYIDYMNEFLMIYYGAGWQYIKEYIELANECANKAGCWTDNYDYPWDDYDKDYYRDHYERFEELFQLAYDAAGTNEQKFRVERTRVNVRFMGLSATYRCDWLEGDSESQAKYRERYEWLWQYYKDHPRMFTMNSKFVGKEGEVGLMYNFPDNPSIIKDPMNWLLGDDWFGTRKNS